MGEGAGERKKNEGREVAVGAGSDKCTCGWTPGETGPAEPVRFLQLVSVRGREASEAGVRQKAVIANCNSSFIFR